MEQPARTVRVIIGLIGKQRRLADSHDPLERAQTLWVAAELDKRLSRCSDWEIAELLCTAEERLPIWEPEFAVVEHARRRLLRSGQMSLLPEEADWEAVRDEGVHLLNVEVALYWARIPHLLLPFQENRFASDVFMVPNLLKARDCLIAAGFRPETETTCVDAETGRPVRLSQER
jgi:hypothetical protein